ncbi:LuxR C-terminal-related transcriptional regulator [Actinoplanes missouriensis]|nr:LuxR family transcriptional regulator [Actinoplanes missouriensis]
METMLKGRAAEEAAIRAAIATNTFLVLTGDTGAGTSALLGRGVEIARAEGFQIARLGALLAAVHRVPGSGGDPLRLRMAVLAVVESLCRRGPVLIAVDDVPEDDREPVALLLFVARRLREHRLSVLLAASGPRACAVAGPGLTVLPVPPLSPAAAAGLVDSLPGAPTGWARAEVLRYAGGNPRALIELTRAVVPAAGAARPSFRLSGELTAGLPEKTRQFLRYASLAAPEDMGTVLAAAGAGLADCRPAEDAGLITVPAGRIVFRHPMVRAISVFSATPEQRREAHRRLAEVLPPGSPSRPWHRLHAADPDAHAASAGDPAAGLGASAAAVEGVARLATGLEAAGLWERAAELSSRPADAARRYGRAATEADRCGDVRWAAHLWQRMTATTGDAAMLSTAYADLGNMAMFRPAAPVLDVVDRLLNTGGDDPGLLAQAARAVLTDGDPADVRRLSTLLAGAAPTADGIGQVRLAFARAVADPAGWTGRHVPLRDSALLRPLPPAAERIRLLCVAGIAWVLDDADIAVDHYRRALDMVSRDESLGVSAIAAVALTEVLFDLGMFDEAAIRLRDAADLVGGNPDSPVRRAVTAQRVTLLTRRGDLDAARALLDTVRADRPDSRLVRCLLHRASGQLAAATGNHGDALDAYLKLFEPGGRPLHYLLSQRSVVELAIAAAESDRRAEAHAVLVAAHARAVRVSPRRAWSWTVALALTSDGPEAEERLRAALADPDAVNRRPYEYARAELCHADLLRSRRRPIRARPMLEHALDAFVRLGAGHDAAAVRERLRAVGIRAQGAADATFTTLTPQRQLIARLAAGGLSNRDIAGRLGLSPRTVGFHLYQIYPALGVARRAQLREVVPA